MRLSTPLAFCLLMSAPGMAFTADPAAESATDVEPIPDTTEAPLPGKPKAALLPSVSFNGDDGLGLGVFGNVQVDAKEGDDRFYIWSLSAVARAWIKPPYVGWEVQLGWSLFPSSDGKTELAVNLVSLGRSWDWWFGVGQEAPRDTRFNRDDDLVPLYWHRFLNMDVRGDMHVFRRIVGPLDAFVGAGVKATWVGVKPGTLLEQEIAAGLRVAPDAGIYGSLDGGLRVDGRDDRTDPTNGGFASGFAQLSVGPTPRPWGRFTLDLRGYAAVPTGVLVFAGELVAQAAVGDVPFYELGLIGGVEPNGRTFAGVNGLRALDRGRLRGPLGLLMHGELRLRPPGFQILNFMRMRIQSVLWVDATRVDELTAPFKGGPFLQPSVGWGLRLIFNEVTVARFDMGTSPERMLTPNGETLRWPLGFYGTVGHSF